MAISLNTNKSNRPSPLPVSTVAGWIVLTICFIGEVYYLNTHLLEYLTSDASSELVLSDFLSRNGRIVSSGFYYSTQLRVFYQQLVFAPLFLLWPGNWQLVRIVGTVILYVLLLACFYFFCSSINLRRPFPWLGSILLLPISWAYAIYVLYLTYYFFFLYAALLLMGIAIRLASCSRLTKRPMVYFCCGCAIAFLEGLEGMRMIANVIIPLSIAILLTVRLTQTSVKPMRVLLCFSAAIFVCSVVGLALNYTVLANIFSFSDFGAVQWTNLNPDGAIEVVNGFISLFGFYPNCELSSMRSLSNLISLTMCGLTIAAIVAIIKSNKKFSFAIKIIAVFSCLCLTMFLGIYSFSTMQFKSRYLIASFIFLVPLIFIYLESLSLTQLARKALTILLALCVGILAISGSRATEAVGGVYRQQNEALLAVKEAVEALGYDAGYATFPYSNILVELSNGEIEMWVFRGYVVDEGRQQMADIQDIYEWLQPKEHSLSKPNKAFVLFSQLELQEQPYAQAMQDHEALFENEQFIVFDSEEVLSAHQ